MRVALASSDGNAQCLELSGEAIRRARDCNPTVQRQMLEEVRRLAITVCSTNVILASTHHGDSPMPLPICPKCFNGFVRRSRRRGLVGHLISLFSVYPYRCQLCQCRFHHFQRGVKYIRVDEDRREYGRLPVNLTATFAAGAVRGQGTIKDISVAGCSLSTEARLEEGNILYLKLQLPNLANHVDVEVAVLRSICSSQASVEFLRFESGERERLQHFIRGLISEGPAGKRA